MEIMRRQQEYEKIKNHEMIHHHQQQQQQQQERERDRERDEREVQRRLDADLAQRNYERERIEQLRGIPYQGRIPYSRAGMPDESVISAQCLINAIITENISRPADARERYVS
jgi:hypothetical protein